MNEPKKHIRNRPMAINGLTFEEAVSKLLKHKPTKEKKPKSVSLAGA